MILFLQQQHEESEECLPARLPVTDLKLAIRAEGYARVIVVVSVAAAAAAVVIGIIVVVVVVVVLVEVSVVLLS